MRIQPVEFIHANDIPYLEGNVIKYVVRHKAKGGREDLEKAKHYIQMIIEMEYPEAAVTFPEATYCGSDGKATP